jgi:hypothetical protein
MGPGFRRQSESRSCRFFISIWIPAQPRAQIQPTGFKIAAVVDIFVRAIETSEFERRLQYFDERLKAQDRAPVAGPTTGNDQADIHPCGEGPRARLSPQ